MPETARLCANKLQGPSQNPDAVLDSISLPEGTKVTGERCLEHLLEISFPGFRREYGELFAYEVVSLRRFAKRIGD